MPGDSRGKLARTFAARRGVAERFEAWARAHRDTARPLLWVHAPSVGEGLMALPVVRRVRAERPDVQIVYTFFSPSAERFATSVGADYAEYLPFDRGATMARVLRAVRPTALVFSKLDVWPALVEQADAQGVALGLISGSFTMQSSRRGKGASFIRPAYGALDRVGAVSDADARYLVEAGVQADRVRITGDTRYDQAYDRIHTTRQHIELVESLRRTNVFTLVAGSTWPTDEAVLLSAWEHVAKSGGMRLIIAPHEIDSAHLQQIEQWADRAGLQCRRLDVPDVARADVVLINRIGVLADLYAIADVAYVGGGFHQAGLHSVVEPAVCYVPVLVGPQHHASRDAKLLLAAGGAQSAHDVSQLTNALETIKTDGARRTLMRVALQQVVSDERGAVDRSVEIVWELLGAV